MATNNEQGAGAQGNTEAPKPGETKPAANGAAGGDGKNGEQKPGEAGKGGEAVKETAKPGDGTQTTKEEKPGDQGGKGGDGGKGGEQKGAPEKYELTIPEGSTLDESDIKAIEAIAREQGLDNEAAQAAVQRHADTLAAQSASFLAETTADKEYGGDKLPATQARAKAVIDLVRPASHPRAKAFRALLDKSGYGNNIEVISFLADLGKMTEEDGVTGTTAAGTKQTKSPEETLYNGQ